MADEASTLVADSEQEDTDQQPPEGGTGGGQVSRKPRRIVFGKPFEGRAVIDEVLVNGQLVTPYDAVDLQPGDEIIVQGRGLANFSLWRFFQKGKRGKTIPNGKLVKDDKNIIFTIPHAWSFSSEPVIMVFSKQENSAVWQVPAAFYFGEEEKQEEKARQKEEDRLQEGAKLAGQTGTGVGPAGIVDAAGQAIGGIAAALAPRLAKRQGVKDALSSGNKEQIKKAISKLVQSGDEKGLRDILKATTNKEHQAILEEGLETIRLKKPSQAQVASHLEATVDAIDFDDADGEDQVSERQDVEEVMAKEAILSTAPKIGGKAQVEVKDRSRVQAQGGEIRQVGEAAAVAGTASASVRTEMQESGKPEIKVTDKRRVTAEGQAQAGGGQISTSGQTEVAAEAQVSGGGSEVVQSGGSIGAKAEVKSQEIVSAQAGVSAQGGGGAESTKQQQISGSGATQVGIKQSAEAEAGAESGGAGALEEEKEPTKVLRQLEIARRLAEKAPIGGGAGQPVTGGRGGLNPRQSSGAVGKYLDKNPGLIPDARVRRKVLQALALGSLAELGAEGRVALKQAIKDIQKQAPSDQGLNDAGANLKQELDGVSQVSATEEAVSSSEPESVGKKLELAAMVKKLAEQDRKLSGAKGLGGAKKPGAKRLADRGITHLESRVPGEEGSSLGQQLAPPEDQKPLGMPELRTQQAGPEEDEGLDISDLEGSEEDRTWVKRSLIVKRSLKIAEEIGRLTGREDLANIAQDLQNGLSWDDIKNLNDAGAIRNAASNLAGNYAAGKAASGLGLSGGKSAAIGGAVAGLASGEGAGGIAKNALSWYVLYVAFGALFTLIGSIPALIYLDIHYIMSKMGVSWFASMTVKQRATLLVANIVIVGLTALAVVSFMYIGCHYPFGKIGIGGVSTYKGSVMGLAGYGSICESFEGGGFAGGGGSSGGAGASGSFPPSGNGKCVPVASGPASVTALQTTCFDGNAAQASSIANIESAGGNAFIGSSVDKCQPGDESVSWGLFQINLTNHKIAGLNCPAAFDYPAGVSPREYDAKNHQCTVKDKSLYDQCVLAAQQPDNSIQVACQISQNGAHWGQWGANSICNFNK